MNKLSFTTWVPDEKEMLVFGAKLAAACGHTGVIFLYGDLGAGKTTLARGFLQGAGFGGKVKSPTYTLVEPYEFPEYSIFHFDFYRLHHPEELEFIGIQDYFVQNAICLIEWPEQGRGLLPMADLCCYIEPCFRSNLNAGLQGRQVRLEAHSEHGQAILNGFLQDPLHHQEED